MTAAISHDLPTLVNRRRALGLLSGAGLAALAACSSGSSNSSATAPTQQNGASCNDNKPREGAAIYLWHCNIDGHYSLHDSSIKAENYLRGIQAADADGKASFASIYPDLATGAGQPTATNRASRTRNGPRSRPTRSSATAIRSSSPP